MTFTWDVDPVLIHIWGPFGIRYYGLLFSIVFIVGFLLFRWQVTRAGGSEDDAYDVILPGAVGVIVGARLGHILFYQPRRLIEDPLWIIKIWEGGLASHGAALGVLAALWWYARTHRQSYLETLDRFSFSVATATILVRVGNFINSGIVGRLTDQTWGVRFPRFDAWGGGLAPLRHPSQLYEAAMGAAVMALLFGADRYFGREKRPRGVLIGVFGAAYFTGRFVVEFFKEYHVLHGGVLTMGQILSIPLALLGYGILAASLLRRTPAHWRVEPPPRSRPGKTTGSKKKRKGNR
jgi:prolipoprotein diacylglyceryl transferase